MFSYPHYGTSPASYGRDTSLLLSHHQNQTPDPNRGSFSSHSHRERRLRRPSRSTDLEVPSEVDEDDATEEDRLLGQSAISIAVSDTDESGSEAGGPSHSTARPSRRPTNASYVGSPSGGHLGMMRPRAFSATSGRSAFSRIIDQVLSDSTPLTSPLPNTIDRPASPSTTTPEPFGAELRRELVILGKYSLPIIGTHFLEYSLLVVTVVSVGHLGTIELAASSLASMSSNVVALSIIIASPARSLHGFAAALDTLCPQAYTSENPKLTSLYAMRTMFLLSLLLIPQFVIFWNAEPILLALRQDPRVAEKASQYLRVLSFGLPGYGVFEVSRRWLQAQGLMSAPTLCLIFVAPFNVVMNYLLVWGPESIRIGFLGAPLATMLSFNLMAIFCVLYCIFVAPRTAWGGFSLDIFRDLGLNFRLGLGYTAMIMSEWVAWEGVGLAASLLGPVTLAAQSVILTVSSCAYQLPYSVSAAAAVRTGNLLGAGKPRLTRIALYAALLVAGVVSVINVVIMVAGRSHLPLLFTSDPEVIEIVAQILPLVGLFQVADSVSGIAGGVLRGVGKASAGALINVGAYYVIGLPLGFALTFSKLQLGLYGLWTGLSVALASVGVVYTIFLLRLDFDAEAARARQRMGTEYGTVAADEGTKPANGTSPEPNQH